MELQLSRQINQSSLSVKPRNSGGHGQLRTDAAEVGGDDNPPYDLCNNTLWGWVEKQSIGLELLYRKCFVIFLCGQNQVQGAEQVISPKLKALPRLIRDGVQEIDIINDFSKTFTAIANKK